MAQMVAVLLLLVFAAPFALWGDPYPQGIWPYWAVGGGLALLLASFAAFGMSGRFDSLTARLTALIGRPSPRAWSLFLLALSFGLGLAAAAFAFSFAPSTPDEVSQLWHARLLLDGHLSLPVDPNREFFALETIVDIDRWYSHFPIGGPLALIPGAAIGAPWLVNPAFAGAATVATYAFARRAFSETEARVASLLLAFSPMLVMMSGTWMNHLPVLALGSLSLVALWRWVATAPTRAGSAWAALLGLMIGAMATIRPLDAVALAVAIGSFQAWHLVRERVRFGSLPFQLLGGLAGASPLLIANARTTGSPWRFGYEVIWGREHGLGSRVDPYGELHTLGAGVANAIAYLGELNLYLLAWPLPATLLLAAGLSMARRLSKWDALLLAVLVAQVSAYVFYWGKGSFLGPRFLFSALPAVVVLLVRGAAHAGDRFAGRGPRIVQALGLACAAISVGAWWSPFSIPGIATQVRGARQVLKADLAGAARDAGIDRGLIFVREPMSGRLARRLWAAGFLRRDAVRILARADACSVVDALRVVEQGGLAGPEARESLLRGLRPFVDGPGAVRARDPEIHIGSAAAASPACRTELDLDAAGSASYGVAFLLNEFDDAGRVAGDLIWVADLGERNEALRARFGDRPWYTLTLRDDGNGKLLPVLTSR